MLLDGTPFRLSFSEPQLPSWFSHHRVTDRPGKTTAPLQPRNRHPGTVRTPYVNWSIALVRFDSVSSLYRSADRGTRSVHVDPLFPLRALAGLDAIPTLYRSADPRFELIPCRPCIVDSDLLGSRFDAGGEICSLRCVQIGVPILASRAVPANLTIRAGYAGKVIHQEPYRFKETGPFPLTRLSLHHSSLGNPPKTSKLYIANVFPVRPIVASPTALLACRQLTVPRPPPRIAPHRSPLGCRKALAPAGRHRSITVQSPVQDALGVNHSCGPSAPERPPCAPTSSPLAPNLSSVS